MADAETVALAGVIVANVSSVATLASIIWTNRIRAVHETSLELGMRAHSRALKDQDELRGILDESLAAAREAHRFVYASQREPPADGVLSRPTRVRRRSAFSPTRRR
jgi:hypothetical protein